MYINDYAGLQQKKFQKFVWNLITVFYVFLSEDFKNAIRFFSITSGFLTKHNILYYLQIRFWIKLILVSHDNIFFSCCWSFFCYFSGCGLVEVHPFSTSCSSLLSCWRSIFLAFFSPFPSCVCGIFHRLLSWNHCLSSSIHNQPTLCGSGSLSWSPNFMTK